jgi:hypothetical protein
MITALFGEGKQIVREESGGCRRGGFDFRENIQWKILQNFYITGTGQLVPLTIPKYPVFCSKFGDISVIYRALK